jgi:iron complex outermembrane receptor protein
VGEPAEAAADESAAEEEASDTSADATAPDAAGVTISIVKPVGRPVVDGNRVDDFGRQDTLVTRDQIETLDAQDLPSAVRRVPGVAISRHNPVGSFGGGDGGAVFIRGQGATRPGAGIQMRVDGVPKRVGVWDHPLMDVLSVDPIERIEVRKGADPVFSGNAAFGAIDMTTKRRATEGMEGKIVLEGGSYGTFIQTAETGGKRDRWDYYLVQSYRRSDGHRDDASGSLQAYMGRLGYQISKHWYASLVVHGTDNSVKDPGGVLPDSPEPDGRYDVADVFGVLTAENAHSWGRGHIKGYFEIGDIDWVNEFNEDEEYLQDTDTDYANGGIQILQRVGMPWEGGEASVGFDLDIASGEVVQTPHEEGESPTHTGRESFLLAMPYLAFKQVVRLPHGFRLTPSAGVRFFGHDTFRNEWGPQAGLVFGRGGSKLHFAYARGINYPGLYAELMPRLIPGFQPFDDGLDPEIVDHFEAGVTQDLGEWLSASAVFFHDDGHDRFLVVPPRTFANVEDFRFTGVEATVTLRPTPALSLFAGMTWLDADPEDLPYAPEWSASAGLNWRFLDCLELSLDALYLDDHLQLTSRKGVLEPKPIDGFFLLNGRIGYEMPLPSQRVAVEIFLVGENLTDADYEHKYGYPMPGFNARGGVALRF